MSVAAVTQTLADWVRSLPAPAITLPVIALCLLRLFVDSYYFLRMIGLLTWEKIRSAVSTPIDFLDELKRTVIVLPTDLDHWGHMNNSRYNRECDFSRTQLLMRNGFARRVRSDRLRVALVATTMRFRRSMHLLDTAWCTAKITYWDDRAFYVEQKFIRKSDGFLFAVGYAKMVVVGTPVATVLERMSVTAVRPELEEDLSNWIKYIDESSEKFRPKTS